MFVLLITMSTTLQPECLNISGKGDGNENDEDCDEDDELCEGVSFFIGSTRLIPKVSKFLRLCLWILL